MYVETAELFEKALVRRASCNSHNARTPGGQQPARSTRPLVARAEGIQGQRGREKNIYIIYTHAHTHNLCIYIYSHPGVDIRWTVQKILTSMGICLKIRYAISSRMITVYSRGFDARCSHPRNSTCNCTTVVL